MEQSLLTLLMQEKDLVDGINFLQEINGALYDVSHNASITTETYETFSRKMDDYNEKLIPLMDELRNVRIQISLYLTGIHH